MPIMTDPKDLTLDMSAKERVLPDNMGPVFTVGDLYFHMKYPNRVFRWLYRRKIGCTWWIRRHILRQVYVIGDGWRKLKEV